MGISKAKLLKLTKDELVEMVLDLRKELKEATAKAFNHAEYGENLKEDLESLQEDFDDLSKRNGDVTRQMYEAESSLEELKRGIINNIKRMA